MADWEIVRLNDSHERSGFECGKPSLDGFIRSLAGQYERRGLGRTFVAVRAGERRVDGYYTVAAGALELAELPPAKKKLPRHPVPVLLLARLAVDGHCRGKGLGQALLFDALTRACRLGEELGIHAVEVDAIDEDAARFYQKYGFVPLLDQPRHLFLALESIRKVMSEGV